VYDGGQDTGCNGHAVGLGGMLPRVPLARIKALRALIRHVEGGRTVKAGLLVRLHTVTSLWSWWASGGCAQS